MNDFIRKEKFLGGEKIIVGDKRTDLILESLGKVYIKSGNSSRLLNDIISTIDKLSKEDISATLILEEGQTINDIEFPGNGKLVYDGTILYLTINNDYIPIVDKSEGANYVKKTGDTLTGQLTIDLEDTSLPPLVVNSSTKVSNLNAEFIGGETLQNYTNRQRDESISGRWSFQDLSSKNIITNTITGDEGFSSGLFGYGMQLDNNTLTIDNVIIRKSLQILSSIEESYENKILETGGNLWSSTSKLKLTEVKGIEVLESSILEKTTSIGIRNVYFSGSIDESFPLCSGFDENGNQIELEESQIRLNLDSTTNGLYNFYDYFQGDFMAITSDTPPKVNEIYRCQNINEEGIKYYDCVVTNVLNDGISIVRCSETVNDVYIKEGQRVKNKLSKEIQEAQNAPEEVSENNEEDDTEVYYVDSPDSGDELILIGNISEGYNGLYLASIDDDSPALNVIENSTTPDYQAQNTLNSRIGILSNIQDTDLNPNGVGIYTKNIFAKTDKWIIGNGEIKCLEDTGVTLNNNGKIEVRNNSVSPFGDNAEDYIRNSLNYDLTVKIEQLESLVNQLSAKIGDLENRLIALEKA